MINNSPDRLAGLMDQDDILDQTLLDIDPDTDLFWELTAEREAVQKTIALLLASRKDA